jgi:hypothetical protein
VSLLLRGAFTNVASIVYYASSHIVVIFVGIPLSGARRSRGCQIVVAPWLSTISCKVSEFSTIITGKDFPLSILLYVSSFLSASIALLVLISSWEDIFSVCESSSYPIRCRVHSIWINLSAHVRSSPLIAGSPVTELISWFRRFWGESVQSALHVYPCFLLFDGSSSPSFVVAGFDVIDYIPIHGMGQRISENLQH